MRNAIGSSAVLGLRRCIDDWLSPEPGGVGQGGLCKVGTELIDTGLFDYLNHSEGPTGAHYAGTSVRTAIPTASFLPLTRGLKEATPRGRDDGLASQASSFTTGAVVEVSGGIR